MARRGVSTSDSLTGIDRTTIIHGMRRERRFWKAFTKYGLLTQRDAPPWYLGIRKATKIEDQRGVDFFILTDRGEIAIDVKSNSYVVDISIKNTVYISKRRIVILPVGHPFMDHAQSIRLRTFDAVNKLYNTGKERVLEYKH